MTNKELIGSRLKEIREVNKISQNALAKELGVTQAAIAQYEAGKSFPNEDVLIKYAQHFKVSMDYIFGITQFMNRDKITENLAPGTKDYETLEAVIASIIKKQK